MSLTRVTPPGTTPVSPDDLADHLRLAVAAPETEQSAELARLLDAATTLLERRLDTAFITQLWRLKVRDWRHANPLPLAPVQQITAVRLVDATDALTGWTDFRLVEASFTRRITTATGTPWPAIPPGGHAEIDLSVGYGPAASDVPADLRHAIRLLAAYFFENREAVDEDLVALPLGVASLTAPYRPIRF